MMKRAVLVLCAALAPVIAVGCKCNGPPGVEQSPPDARNAPPPDAGAPVTLAPAEARERWIRLVGAEPERFRAFLALSRDLQQRCADPEGTLAAGALEPAGKFIAELAREARQPADRDLLVALARAVKQAHGKRCSEGMRLFAPLVGGKP